MGKVSIHNARNGVEFLGAYVRPYRKYMSNAALKRSINRINNLNTEDKEACFRSINSFLGILTHYSSYNIRCNLFLQDKFLNIAPFNKEMTKMGKP